MGLEGFEPLSGAASPSGVYALLWKGEVVYVGQAKNVYQRITTHYNRLIDNTYVAGFVTPGDIRGMTIRYDSAMVLWTAVEDLKDVEQELIWRLRPKYNRQVLGPIPKVKVNLAALKLKPMRRRVAA